MHQQAQRCNSVWWVRASFMLWILSGVHEMHPYRKYFGIQFPDLEFEVCARSVIKVASILPIARLNPLRSSCSLNSQIRDVIHALHKVYKCVRLHGYLARSVGDSST